MFNQKLILHKFILCLSMIFTISTSNATELKRPNILLISADDMGFDDRSAQNHPYINTPNLDKLANQSLQFTDFSVTPVCATTRASLLTGRDFYKTGVSGVHGGRDYMHLSETLISQTLQDNNYRTGIWGKWHIGKSKGYMPEDRGFDQAYYSELYKHKNNFGFLNGKLVKHNKWVSEVITDYAIDFMSEKSSKPFFAYVSFLAPHEPWLAPKKYVQPLISKGLRPAIANLYGMVEEMDFHIGRLLAFLEQNKLAENTVVIFLSDNGPWWDSSNFGAMTKTEWQERNPSKMNGNKGQSWQNGIKSPLFIRWKGHWHAKKINRYSDVKDIYPTIIDLLDINLPTDHKKIDGYSLLPLITADTSYINPRSTFIASHDVISRKKYFNQWTPIDSEVRKNLRFNDQIIGLRTEQYKLLLNPAMDRDGYPTTVNNFALFNMQKDPLEQTNIFNQKPLIAQQMKTKLYNKFIEIRDDKNSFRPPVYIIDANENVSIINGFGPSSISGNTQSKAHVLSNLKAKGDLANFKMKVIKGGDFDIYIKQKNTESVGMQVSIKVNQQVLTHQFTEQLIQKVGTLSLTTHDSLLVLSVLANNSYKPWAQISSLSRIFLVPKNKTFDFKSLHIPQ